MHNGTKAGLIPYFLDSTSGNFKYLMMVSSDAAYGGSLPMVSKGGQDPEDEHGNQETVLDCAIREAVEELGLKEENLVGLPAYLMSASYKTYELFMFSCEIKDINNFDKPCYETEYTIWLTAEEFAVRGRKDHQVFVNELERRLRELQSEDNLN